MIGALRSVLRRGYELIERPLDRLFGPALNPVAQLGALGFFFYWIVAASGIYLFVFFDTGIERAYESVEHLTYDLRWHAGVMRSLHRYASDLMVVMLAAHLIREFAYDRYRGARWFSWFTGVPIIWLLYGSGITGYWLVWDRLAQFVAVATSQLLDWLPIFGEPIARNFIVTGTLTSRFFTLMVFMHVAVPLILLFLMWVHILRISRPKVNPPRLLAGLSLAALTAVSLWKPAVSQGHVDLAKVPADIGLDWFYLPLYPLARRFGDGAVWALLGAFTLMLALMPWLPPLRRAGAGSGQPDGRLAAPERLRAAVVDLAHCNGCERCAEDCPFEAIRMVRRSDGMPFPTQAEVNPALCVGCGICVGACPSSTPFRRSAELATGIDLPDLPLRELRAQTIVASQRLGGAPRVLVLACRHGGGADRPNAVVMPCVAMAPPSLIDFVISRKLADAVVVAGCAESACYNRLGVAWTQDRFAGRRDPYLRARVPRERLATIWASALEKRRSARELAAFRAAVATLPSPAARAAPAPRADQRPPDLAAVDGANRP